MFGWMLIYADQQSSTIVFMDLDLVIIPSARPFNEKNSFIWVQTGLLSELIAGKGGVD